MQQLSEKSFSPTNKQRKRKKYINQKCCEKQQF